MKGVVLILNSKINESFKIFTKEDILLQGGIYIETILQGFETCDSYFLEGTSQQIKNEIKRLQELNGIEFSFVDFYYGALANEEKERVKEGLTLSSLLLLKRYEKLEQAVYLSLDENILDLTAELNAKEMLFSTYYFCKYPCTIWGNYGLKYPVFTKRGSCNKESERFVT